MSAPRWTFQEMTEDDLDAVLTIERGSFSAPWNRENFRFELRSNPFARNVTVKDGEQLVGYACSWVIGSELKINNIAVRRERRRAGLGTALLRFVLRAARAQGCTEAELEVRPSNEAALRLYTAHGFREVRRRKGYYQDTREDAIVMAVELVDALRDLDPPGLE